MNGRRFPFGKTLLSPQPAQETVPLPVQRTEVLVGYVPPQKVTPFQTAVSPPARKEDAPPERTPSDRLDLRWLVLVLLVLLTDALVIYSMLRRP